MKINSVSIKNFLVIGEAFIELDGRGLMLVQGVNNDDSSANSNGAGKSSIVDAISWCLYGVTARDVSGDEVVNNKIGKDCCVSLVIQDGEAQYTITRFRKHKEGKNDLIVAQDGVAEPLTKGTTALTQELINKIVGCSHEVFVASVYSGQEKMPDLPRMTDKQLKMIVEEAAGIERLQAASEIATKRQAAAQRDVDVISASISKKNTEIVNAETDIKRYSDMLDAIKLTKLEEISNLKSEIETKRMSLKFVTDSLDVMGEEQIRKDIDNINLQIEGSQGAEKEKLAELRKLEAIAEKALSVAETKLNLATSDAKKRKLSLDTVSDRLGQPCGECGKAYCQEDLAPAKLSAEASLKVALLSLRDVKAAKEDAEKQLTIAQTTRSDFEASMTDVSALAKRGSDLQKKLELVEATKTQQSRIVSEIKQLKLKSDAAKKAIEEAPYAEMADKKFRELEEMNAELLSLTADLEVAEELLDTTQKASVVFGRAGARAHILDTVTPFLNERTSEYLGTLTDGNITASWSTISKTAKGELREKFSVTAEKRNGSKSFAGLSGGEKRKVRLATAMALQELVASRATKPIEFLLYDEIDDAIDASGLERLMTILEARGREKGTVLVISHNDLNSYIDNFITVTNTGGISTVSE